jgi:hypothetical protein
MLKKWQKRAAKHFKNALKELKRLVFASHMVTVLRTLLQVKKQVAS